MFQTLIYVPNPDIYTKPYYMFQTLTYFPNRDIFPKPWCLFQIHVPNPYICFKPLYMSQIPIYVPNPNICSKPDYWFQTKINVPNPDVSNSIFACLVFLHYLVSQNIVNYVRVWPNRVFLMGPRTSFNLFMGQWSKLGFKDL